MRTDPFVFASRKTAVINATVRANGRQRIAEAAGTLTRSGLAKAKAELCCESVQTLTRLCYEVDEDLGIAANVDWSGVIMIPMPWGRSYQRWGLRSTEAVILRRHMLGLATATAPPLFVYDEHVRRWILNRDYSSLVDALDYWRQHEISPKLFAIYASNTRLARNAMR